MTLGNTYSTTVRAFNAIGESVDSSSVNVYSGTVPSKILNVVLDASTTTSITIRYDPPETNGGLTLTSFNIYHDIGQTGSFTQIQETDVSVLTRSLTGLTTGALIDI